MKGLVAIVLIVLLLAGCSRPLEEYIPDRRTNYRTVPNVQALEIPPELKTDQIQDNLSQTFGDNAPGLTQESIVLPTFANMRIERDEQQRWLMVDAKPAELWSPLQSFWSQQDILMQSEDPVVGVMKTQWLENRPDVNPGGVRSFLQNYLGFIYSTPTRYKFRLRLEREGQQTAVYLTPFAMEEIVERDGPSIRSTSGTVWQPAPPDPGLQAIMLRRLMVHLGATPQAAEKAQQQAIVQPTGPKSRLTQQAGQTALLVNSDYNRTWRRVGLAIDGADWSIDDQNRSEGRYIVEFLAKKDSWWPFGDDEVKQRYQIRLAGQGSQTVVIAQNAQGDPLPHQQARTLLEQLQKSISGP